MDDIRQRKKKTEDDFGVEGFTSWKRKCSRAILLATTQPYFLTTYSITVFSFDDKIVCRAGGACELNFIYS